MSRLPLRGRLALAFALVMALVLGVVGLFIYTRLAADLDETVDRELAARLAGVVAIVVDDGDDLGNPVEDPLRAVDEAAFVQVLDATGAVAGTTARQLARRPVLPQRGLAQLARSRETADVTPRELGRELRLAVAAARDDGEDYMVIVGASLEGRNATLADLHRLLLLGGPIALLLASLAAYAVAAGALRPVEHMRRRAAAISTDGDHGGRLPVPPARDEIARLGSTLNAMLDRIDRAFERERAFTSDASHELRTPLTILKTELDLVRQGRRSREELEAALASASEEADRLVRLAEDLLVLARADDGRLPLAAEQVDLGALAARVAGRFEPRAGAAGRTVQRALPADPVRVTGDPLRMEQALTNLLDNALRYGDGAVCMAVARAGGAAELRVTDDGPGFPDELAGRAFDRFVRADHGRARGGSGLGLSIVSAIARAHGGAAHAANRPHGGAEVWLTLPLTRRADESRRTPLDAPAAQT